MASTSQYPADGPNGASTIQAVKVNYDYTPVTPQQEPPQRQEQIQITNETCCGCLDIRSGIIALGIWLLFEAILELIFWLSYEHDAYSGEDYNYAVSALIISIVFNLIGIVYINYINYIYPSTHLSHFIYLLQVENR